QGCEICVNVGAGRFLMLQELRFSNGQSSERLVHVPTAPCGRLSYSLSAAVLPCRRCMWPVFAPEVARVGHGLKMTSVPRIKEKAESTVLTGTDTKSSYGRSPVRWDNSRKIQ